MRDLMVLLLLCFGCFRVNSSRIERCQLVKALLDAGFEKSLLSDWICLVQAESNFNSTARGGPNKNGSYDHGLFQINDKYWCDFGKPGKDCNMKCEDLASEDLSASIECAKIVYRRHKFSAWYGWTRRCKGRTLPDLSGCLEQLPQVTTPDGQVETSTNSQA